MGYDVHITRAESWSENEGRWITAEEWDAIVRADPELELYPENGPHFAEWKPAKGEGWLNWNEGNIYTKNPDEALVRKMCRVAAQINANVQGDDGERYPEALKQRAPEPPSLALWSLKLSALSLVPLMLGFWLDRGHVAGAARSSGQSLVLAALMGLFAFTWLNGVQLAVASWFFGRKNPLLSLAATTGCIAIALILLLRR